MSIFSENCQAYLKLGISPLPITPGSKAVPVNGWSQFCERVARPEEVESWASNPKFANAGIGLALGIPYTDGYRLVAIDIDHPEIQGDVEKALGANCPGKVGSKGATYFVRAIPTIKARKYQKKVKKAEEGVERPAVEVLAGGNQTVIPPTIHGKTGKPYFWLETCPSYPKVHLKPLHETEPSTLPIINESTIDEIVAIVDGKNELFRALNNMVWKGVGGGGNTDDTRVAWIACAVARGWKDEDIMARAIRATKEAVERAGESYNWPDGPNRIQENIDSARAKGFADKTSRKADKGPPAERVIADWMLEQLGGRDFVACVDGRIRVYSNGYWPEVNENNLKGRMLSQDANLTKSDVNSAVDVIKFMRTIEHFGITPDVEPVHDPLRRRICMMNGTFSIDSMELMPHAFEHQLIHQLPFEYDAEAICPNYDQLIHQTFNKDQQVIDFFEEFIFCALTRDTSHQKFTYLLGQGQNGKSSLVKAVAGLFDPQGVSAVSTSDLSDERSRTSLVGKQLNICGEQSRLNTVDIQHLKAITGGDPIQVRYLYQETKAVTLSVHFLELTNQMPRTSDYGYSMERRMVILPCPNQVKSPDLDLPKKLKAERAGIFNRIIKAGQRYLQRERLEVPEVSRRMVAEYLTKFDLVKQWVTENCRILTEEDLRNGETLKGTPTGALYADFKEWCLACGVQRPLDMNAWADDMDRLGYYKYRGRFQGKPSNMRPVELFDNGLGGL